MGRLEEKACNHLFVVSGVDRVLLWVPMSGVTKFSCPGARSLSPLEPSLWARDSIVSLETICTAPSPWKDLISHYCNLETLLFAYSSEEVDDFGGTQF